MTHADIATITAAVIAALNAKPAKAAKLAKPAKVGKADLKLQRKAGLDRLTIDTFEARGFSPVIPRVNVLTAKRWAAKGKAVKAGQEPIWVKAPWMTAKQMGYPMFHADQVA